MTASIHAQLERLAEQTNRGSGLDVLEVGSCYIDSQRHLQPRLLFTDAKSFTGVDLITGGEGVDLVVDVASRHIGFERYDVVLCMEVIEHAPSWHRVIQHCYLALRKDGTFACSTPNNGFPLHRHPVDCYRFLEDGFREGVMGWFHAVEIIECPDGAHSCWYGRGVK